MTAVEWFFKQLTEVDYGCINKTFLQNNNSLAGHKLRELLEQAKEMEKQEEQEKIDFADKYGTYLLQGGIMSAAAYNETFKSEQTEDTLKLVLNDIKNTPEDVFNKQWASINKPRTK